MSMKVNKISISGFKTFKRLEEFEPRGMNVLIGGNGSGKSNFISLFRLLNWMLTPPGQLQWFIANNGGAGAFLLDGPAITPALTVQLEIETESGLNEYYFRLFHSAGDTFRFAEEKYRYSKHGIESRAKWTILEPGVAEANINVWADQGEQTAYTIRGLLRRCIVYQFHNTSTTSRIKQRWNKDDGRLLKEDGANLGPFLLRLRESETNSYGRIVGTIRQAVPFFSDFVLEPINGTLLLQWREIGSDMVFSSYQGPDGMLRFFALVALLLQPEDDLPHVLIIDEPELGLHPQALELIAGLLRSVSRKHQVFVATQSTMFVDQFQPEDIIVVNRIDRTTEMKRLVTSDLEDWLTEFEGGRGYSLSELWEKNVLGGEPSR